MYKINEMFETIQGEGVFTGVPAVFVRLQICPVGCSWCDTKQTWEALPEDETSLGDIMVKTEDYRLGLLLMLKESSMNTSSKVTLQNTL